MTPSNKSLKRSLPLALLAVAIAESAHAPLVGGALTSPENFGSGKPALVAMHTPRDPDRKAPITWTAPPIADSNDASNIRKKLKELEGEQLYDPLKPIRSDPTVTQPDPTVASHVDLLPGTGLVNPEIGGTGPEEDFQPVFHAQPTSVVIAGGDLPTDPDGPTFNPPQSPVEGSALPPITPVPEPATISVLACGLWLVLRPTRNIGRRCRQ